MVKVSVVVPIYNQEKYLRDCLESIVFQNLEEIEIICVNDGSTDASSNILSEFEWQDKRIRIINQSNKGVSSARNHGLREACGEYVAFIDPDDWYYDFTVLEKLYSHATENQALICGGCFTIQHEKYGEKEIFTGNEARYTFAESRMYTYEEYQYDYGFHRFIYRRDFLLENSLFFPSLISFEDPVWFTQVMHKAGSFYGLADKVYAYRSGHKPVAFDKEKVADIIRGITDVASLAIRESYSHLRDLECDRLVREKARDIYPYICREDEEITGLLRGFEELTGLENVSLQILSNIVSQRDAALAASDETIEKIRTSAENLRVENGVLKRELSSLRQVLKNIDSKMTKVLKELQLPVDEEQVDNPKNVLPYPYVHKSHEKDGITWKDLGDGRIEAHGVAECDTVFDLTLPMTRTTFATHHKHYVVTVGAENASPFTWYISGAIANKDGEGSALLRDVAIGKADGFSSTFEIDTLGYDYFGRLYIVVKAGRTLDHIVFSPMIVPSEEWDEE